MDLVSVREEFNTELMSKDRGKIFYQLSSPAKEEWGSNGIPHWWYYPSKSECQP